MTSVRWVKIALCGGLVACSSGPREMPSATAASSPAAAAPARAGHVVSAPAVDLVVNVGGLRSRSGSLLVLVHDTEEGFPGDADTAVREATVRLGASPPRAEFEDLPAGDYAVAVFHDENDNRALDTGWFGIPTEGLGASNDAQGSFGPPDFEDARFRLVHERSEVEVRVVYF